MSRVYSCCSRHELRCETDTDSVSRKACLVENWVSENVKYIKRIQLHCFDAKSEYVEGVVELVNSKVG